MADFELSAAAMLSVPFNSDLTFADKTFADQTFAEGHFLTSYYNKKPSGSRGKARRALTKRVLFNFERNSDFRLSPRALYW